MKKLGIAILTLILVLGVSGCTKDKKEEVSQSALDFKAEYEALNGKTNASGKEHRTVSIPENNPYEKITPAELIKKIENKETFYVYFGDPLCPWCRSVIEKSIEVANSKNIDKIYYIKIWDDEGNEVFRSKYTLNKKNKPELVTPGTDEYYTITRTFANVLSDYTLTTDEDKKVNVGEKRIYAPSYIYVKDGKAIKLTEGISKLQTDSREELTKEMLNDETKQFEDFFTN